MEETRLEIFGSTRKSNLPRGNSYELSSGLDVHTKCQLLTIRMFRETHQIVLAVVFQMLVLEQFTRGFNLTHNRPGRGASL